MPARRTYPTRFGRVNGRSGWPRRVWAGFGPERSSPKRRRLLETIEQLERPGRRLAYRQAVIGPSPADLGLDGPLRERPLADDDPQRAPEQLRVGELLPGPRVAIVVDDLGAR